MAKYYFQTLALFKKHPSGRPLFVYKKLNPTGRFRAETDIDGDVRKYAQHRGLLFCSWVPQDSIFKAFDDALTTVECDNFLADIKEPMTPERRCELNEPLTTGMHGV